MEFMDSLKRGVDRAGFEVDRLLRANRVRSRINGLRSQMDEEMRRIGHDVVDLYLRGQLVQQELVEHCERVRQYQAEIAEREAELEAINREVPPAAPHEALGAAQPAPATCPSCGAGLPAGAIFCPRCGTRVEAARPTPPPTEGAGEEQR